jgi:ribosomal protein L32
VHVRVCPECGEEFRPEIAVCSDCGAALQDRWEDEGNADEGDAPIAPPAPVAAPDADGKYVPIHFSERAADLEPLAQRLGSAGVPFRVKAAVRSFVLLARDEDQDRVASLLADLVGSAPHASTEDFDPASGYRRCPACGQALGAGAVECPECGLGIGSEADDATCPECGSPRPPGAACPSCGAGGAAE